MGLDPMMLLGLMGNMGNMGQGAANTALSAVPTAISLRDRMRLRRDPVLNLLNMRDLGQGYRAITQNPYGDPWSGWGGSFGTDQSGNPVGFGEANARAVMEMMGQTPGASTVANYQQLAQQRRPDVADTTAGMTSLLGMPSYNLGGDVSPMFKPKAAGDMKRRKPGKGGGSATTPKPPKVAAGAQGGGLPDITGVPNVNLNIGGGGGFGPGGIAGRVLGNAFQRRGGLPGFIDTMRGPGNAPNNLMDFAMNRPGGVRTQGGPGMPMANPDYANLLGNQKPNGMPSYAVGSFSVPQTGVARVHKDEAIIPAPLNPFKGKTGPMLPQAGGYDPNAGVPPGGQSFGGTGKAQGASGGIGGGGVPVAPTAQPHSLLQDVFANPMSLTPEIQQQIINRGTDSLTNNYGAMARGAWDRSAAMGGAGANPNMAALNFGLAGGVSDINRDVGIESARTNYGDLLNAAGLQWGATRDTAQQALQQQALDQGLYTQDQSSMGRIIDMMTNAQSGDINQQSSLWQMLNNLGTGGIQFPNTFLDRLRYGRMNQLVPNSVQMPTQNAVTPNPMTLGNAYQLTAWQ